MLSGKKPGNFSIYKKAFTHHTVSKSKVDSNERLEFLGDSIIGSIVAIYLYKKYPNKDEGFLTQIRSKIVNRNTLNEIAGEIGFNELLYANDKIPSRSVSSGNAFEAFIGAVYIDKGFNFTYDLLIHHIFKQYSNLDKIIETETDFKSKLIQQCQKAGKNYRFKLEYIEQEGTKRLIKIILFIDEIAVSEGLGYSRKTAEQDASEKAMLLIK
jgi:ribonuclease-3